MGCMYAEGPISLCQCSCKGETHGAVAQKHIHAVKCSPAAEKRCKEGNESGACQCACGGINHGLYETIEDFSTVKITQYA
jgi:hypothetical protein